MTHSSLTHLTSRNLRASERWLCRADNHQPVAYARGRTFFRRSDHDDWAYLDDNEQLVSARSGDTIAYRVGSLFFDAATNQRLYYETTWPHQSAPPANTIQTQRLAS